jgi:hypothetical protein
MPRVPADSVPVHAASDLRLEDDDGRAHRLGDAWLERPALLAVLRHFG